MLLGGGRHGGAEVAGGARAWRPRGEAMGPGGSVGGRLGRWSEARIWPGSASGIAGQVAGGLCRGTEQGGEQREREEREGRNRDLISIDLSSSQKIS